MITLDKISAKNTRLKSLENPLYRILIILFSATLPACAFPGIYLEQGSIASGQNPAGYKQVVIAGDRDLQYAIGRFFAEKGYDYYVTTEQAVLDTYAVRRGEIISLNCNHIGQYKQDMLGSTTAKVICKATDLKTGTVLYHGIGEYMGYTLNEDKSGAVTAALSGFPKCAGGYGVRLERLRLPLRSADNAAKSEVKVFLPPRNPSKVMPDNASGCEAGNWIESLPDHGRLIELSDGSIWEVVLGDESTSALWRPTSEVIVCDGKIINTDDNELVEVTRLR